MCQNSHFQQSLIRTHLSIYSLTHAINLYWMPAPCAGLSQWTKQAKISVLLKFSSCATISLVFSCIVTSFSFTAKEPCDYILVIKAIKDNLFILSSADYRNLIPSANLILFWHITTYSQILGIQRRISLGGHYSAFRSHQFHYSVSEYFFPPTDLFTSASTSALDPANWHPMAIQSD